MSQPTEDLLDTLSLVKLIPYSGKKVYSNDYDLDIVNQLIKGYAVRHLIAPE